MNYVHLMFMQLILNKIDVCKFFFFVQTNIHVDNNVQTYVHTIYMCITFVLKTHRQLTTPLLIDFAILQFDINTTCHFN